VPGRRAVASRSERPASDAAPLPEDRHELGRIAGAWGVRGWLKVQPHAADPRALLEAPTWIIEAPEADSPPGGAGPPVVLAIVQARRHADAVIAQVQGLADRAAAQSLRGRRVSVSRAAFPRTRDDEYYWVDLIGLQVVNREGTLLGRIDGLVDTGAHAVLRVRPPDATGERLIPFVSAYVDDVDLDARTVRVDWGLDY
jgi:16S rRNA processing protein RimM